MDKRFHLRAIALFARLVEAGGFTPAAESLELSKSTVSKEIAELERHLGAKLLNRNTRRVELTELGRTYYGYCERVMAEAEAAEAMIAHNQSQPRGTLRFTAPITFGTMKVVPVVNQLRYDYPQLEVDLDLTDRTIDLLDGKTDLSIIVTARPPEHLVARPLASIDWVLCATPDYIARHGPIDRPCDLERHDCLYYRSKLPAELTVSDGSRREQVVLKNRAFRTNNSLALLRAVEAGLGVACLPRYVAEDALVGGRIVPVLEEWTIPSLQAYAVYLPNRYLLPRVRVFIDRLIKSLHSPASPERGTAAIERPGQAATHRQRPGMSMPTHSSSTGNR